MLRYIVRLCVLAAMAAATTRVWRSLALDDESTVGGQTKIIPHAVAVTLVRLRSPLQVPRCLHSPARLNNMAAPQKPEQRVQAFFHPSRSFLLREQSLEARLRLGASLQTTPQRLPEAWTRPQAATATTSHSRSLCSPMQQVILERCPARFVRSLSWEARSFPHLTWTAHCRDLLYPHSWRHVETAAGPQFEGWVCGSYDTRATVHKNTCKLPTVPCTLTYVSRATDVAKSTYGRANNRAPWWQRECTSRQKESLTPGNKPCSTTTSTAAGQARSRENTRGIGAVVDGQ